jgi:lipopolysaccharide/colanic/teichoic acid biosynthesis glycosyltransferase
LAFPVNTNMAMVFHRPIFGPSNPLQRGTKRLFDMVVATGGLLILSPIFLLVSLAIKLDSRGPIFSIQTKHSYGNQIICVLQFRTTVIPLAQGEVHLTRMGRLLARSGLQELPMFLNVLRGEMSIVGPCLYNAVPTWLNNDTLALARNNGFKPGLTGWAQIRSSSKNDTFHTKRRLVEDDLFYIANWSLRFDARIIMMMLLSRQSYVLNS